MGQIPMIHLTPRPKTMELKPSTGTLFTLLCGTAARRRLHARRRRRRRDTRCGAELHCGRTRCARAQAPRQPPWQGGSSNSCGMCCAAVGGKRRGSGCMRQPALAYSGFKRKGDHYCHSILKSWITPSLPKPATRAMSPPRPKSLTERAPLEPSLASFSPLLPPSPVLFAAPPKLLASSITSPNFKCVGCTVHACEVIVHG
jgi:hypothetical protein